MKKIFIFIFIITSFFFCSKTTFSQSVPGENCVSAAPFCTDIVYDFPLGLNTIAESGPNYGCLYTYPNPVWYYLKIANPGNMTIHIVGSNGASGRDVDFICWGPFNSMSEVCTDSLIGACFWAGGPGSPHCPNNTSNPSFYPGQSAPNIIDCSYDARPNEDCRIPNAQHGKYYLLCITNYSCQSGMLTFSKTAGTATTDCSIVYNKAGFDYWHACEGVYTNFSDTSNFQNPITSRIWDFGDGQTDTAKNPTHIYTSAGRYVVRLSVVSDGDTYFTAKEVFVNKIISNITPTSPIDICLGDSVNLNAVVITYPQTYESAAFTKTLDEPIPNTGLDSNYWAGGLPPDPILNGLYVADTINATGIQPGWTINNITVNIEHQKDDDIMVYIKAPGSSFVELIKSVGGNGDNFSRTSFLPPPVGNISIKSSTEHAPYTGNYIPSGGPGIWGTLTGFVNPNGPWVLTVADASNNLFEGTLLDWSIEFNNPKQTGFTYKWEAPINDSVNLAQIVKPTETTTYRLTSTNEYGCTTYSDVLVNIVPDPIITVSSDTSICIGDSVTLFGNGATTYTWMPGNLTGSSITVAPDDTTTYTATGYNDIGCVSDPKSVTVNITTGPTINLKRDTTIAINSSVTITASGAYTYSWMPGNLTGPSITVSPSVETTYYLTGMDASGCITLDTITVKIDYSNTLFIPNIFSPNNDSYNDILYVRGTALKEIEFTIYDRWGEKVFFSDSQDKGWDGTYKGEKLNPGVFVYFLVAKTFDNRIIEKKGNVTLIK